MSIQNTTLPMTLTLDLICRYLIPVHPRTLKRWIAAGEFPQADISKGAKIRFWHRDTIEKWMEQNTNMR